MNKVYLYSAKVIICLYLLLFKKRGHHIITAQESPPFSLWTAACSTELSRNAVINSSEKYGGMGTIATCVLVSFVFECILLADNNSY